MDVIPVLDLMGGRVVQGFRGERQAYQAVRSVLVAGCEPLAIARALCRECGGPAVYVADLDAIAGSGDHLATVGELADRLGPEPWVDAGVSSEDAAARLLGAGAARVIVGTETLSEIGALRALCDALSAETAGRQPRHGRARRPQQVPRAERTGASGGAGGAGRRRRDATSSCSRCASVGTGAGPDVGTLRAARAAFPQLRLIAGGGVRDAEDLRRAGRGRRRRRAARDRASSRLDTPRRTSAPCARTAHPFTSGP